MLKKLNNRWLIGTGVAVIFGFILLLNHKETLFGREEMKTISKDSSHLDDETSEDQLESEDPLIVMVDIKGEVAEPGVYEVENDVRVDDVIQLAGGFTSNANEESINLAEKVHDEMVLIVPQTGDESGENLHTSPNSDQIRLNHAAVEEIEQLTGIGPTKAQAIVDYREEHGMFQTVEDLLNISGIGEKTLDNIRKDIQIP